MAERTPLLVSSQNQNLRAGEQITRMMVWPVDPETLKALPAKIVKVKSPETGKEIEQKIPRIPLYRQKGTLADLESWQLSSYWDQVRQAMWWNWEVVEDIKNPNEFGMEDEDAKEPYLAPIITTYGEIDEKKHISAKSKRSITFADIPYRVEANKGAFGYNKETGKSHVLNEGNVQALIRAMRIQSTNKDTVGINGDGAFPKRLWIPFSEGWTNREKKEIEEYENNLAIFKTWVGKLVYWEFEVYDPTVVLR
jgi:hypothetical protein